MSNYVFISYAHKDKKEVLNSLEALASCGLSYWYDEGIEAGADWAAKISDKLENAKAMLLFLSKAAAKSKNVLREIEFARNHNIPIFTIQLYPFRLPKNIEKQLSVNQFTMLNSFKSYKTFAESFCPALGSLDVIGEKKEGYVDKKIHISGHKVFGKIVLVIFILVILYIIFNKIFIYDIPTVIGMETNPAEINVNDAGFDCAVANGYTEDEDYGYIYEQNKLGTGIKNSTVVISQSLGPEEDLVLVPSVVGYPISTGVSMLVTNGLKTFVINPVKTAEYPISYIADQSIAANYKVSARSKIQLSVSSSEDTIIEINGQKITITDKKLEVKITDDNEVVTTPLTVFGITADYTETDPINASGSITATSRFLISVKREDTDYYGRYHGRFVMDTSIQGDDSFAWKLLSNTTGSNDSKIGIQVKSESFSCKAEEFNEEKYKQFVAEVTGDSANAISYQNPIMMMLGKEIVLTDMSPLARNMEWLYSLTSKVVFAIPKLENNILIQPYSIIVQKDGKAYVAFYGRDGEKKSMEFHGEIKYE